MGAEPYPFGMSWTSSLTQTRVSILSELLKCFILITGSTEQILKIIPTQTLRQAFLNQSRVCLMPTQQRSLQTKLGGTAIDLYSSHLPSQLPMLAEGKGAMGHGCATSRVLADSLTQHCNAFEEWSSTPATVTVLPSCSFVNCLNHTIAFLQLIHQHSLLPVFRGCTLFFLLGY